MRASDRSSSSACVILRMISRHGKTEHAVLERTYDSARRRDAYPRRSFPSFGASMDKTQRGELAKLAIACIATVLLTLIFVPSCWAKFSDNSGWSIAFRHWGYPTWFRI